MRTLARLFFAIELPERLQELVGDLQDRIPRKTGEFSFVAPAQAHITLKFLGETEVNKVLEAVDGIEMRDVTLTTSETGYFPSDSYISVYWYGFHSSEKLAELVSDLDDALPEFERDHAFTPHVTVARVNDLWEKERFKEATGVEPPEVTFSPESFVLVRSELTSDGPEYTVVERFA